MVIYLMNAMSHYIMWYKTFKLVITLVIAQCNLLNRCIIYKVGAKVWVQFNFCKETEIKKSPEF